MAKKTHHSNYIKYGLVAGAVSTLGILGVSQTVNAEQLTVKAGDTIWGLAQQHGITINSLEQANPIVKRASDSIDLIYAGQQLTLPTLTDTNQSLNADGSYTVKPGDTLGTIANHYHVSIQQLMAWNGLSATDSIYIGQHLSIDGTNAVASQPAQQAVVSQAPLSSTIHANESSSVGTAASSQQVVVSQASQTPNNVTVNSSAVVSGTALVNGSATVGSASTATKSATALASSNSENTPAAVNNESASQATTTVVPQQSVAQPASSANLASLYTQSFVQAPTSQSQVQSTVARPQSQVANSSTPVQTNNVADQAQPQSQSASPVDQHVTQPAAPAQNQASAAGQDLQHGSVVSLATKIANSNSVPYVWGGSNLSGMDCSGLVDYVYAHAENKQLPHNTVALESYVNQHAVSEAQPGDLLFWGNHGSTYHTAIYTGNNQYVAAAKPGTNVASYTISPYFQPSFAGTVK